MGDTTIPLQFTSLYDGILELREILLSIQTGFSLVNAAVVCAILESISGLEPSSVITEILSRIAVITDCYKKRKLEWEVQIGM